MMTVNRMEYVLLRSETVESLLLPGTAAYFAFMFWLLIRGVNEKKLLFS